MPRELVTIQVGQCGNQVGCRFWELALREHAAYNTKGVYDEALSSFFRNVDTRVEPPRWVGWSRMERGNGGASVSGTGGDRTRAVQRTASDTFHWVLYGHSHTYW